MSTSILVKGTQHKIKEYQILSLTGNHDGDCSRRFGTRNPKELVHKERQLQIDCNNRVQPKAPTKEVQWNFPNLCNSVLLLHDMGVFSPTRMAAIHPSGCSTAKVSSPSHIISTTCVLYYLAHAVISQPSFPILSSWTWRTRTTLP